jgi:HEPN domain-containing protein
VTKTAKNQLQQLADERLEAARALLSAPAPCWSSSYYLAGYAVELALKACIAGQFQSHEIPDKKFVNDIYTHDLQALLRLAGLDALLKRDAKTSPDLLDNWATVSDWRETSRYELNTEHEASELVQAIGDPVNGVLRWLKKHW